MAKIKWPVGAAEILALTATGAQALTIENPFTIVDGVTVVATGNRTLNLTVSEELVAGALLLVKSKTTATETTIFGTGIDGATVTGVAGKTKNKLFVYDGTTFVAAGAEEQID